MPELLELCVTLAPPPEGAPPGTLAAVALRCDALGLAHGGDLLADPLTAKEREELRWYLEEYWRWPYAEFAERGRQVEALLPEIGRRLYGALFGSVGAALVAQPWRLQPGVRRQISLLGDHPAALALPWELLHDEQGFLALRAREPVSLVRRLPGGELAALPTPFEPPLRVLLATARPEGTGFVDPRAVARELLDELEERVEAGAVVVEFLRPPTLPALRARLGRPPAVHLFHFDGHGSFDAEPDPQDGLRLRGGRQGRLAFEREDGGLDSVAADTLAQVLQHSGVRLAMLTACQSALGSPDDAFSSVAARLIRGGVDAAAAMGASLLVATAARYVEAFYRALAGGDPAATAHERARQALHDDPRRHAHRRRRDDPGRPVELRDWWVPQLYQQRPLALRPAGGAAAPERRRAPAPALLAGDVPPEPRYGFGGRARELLRVERWLLRGRAVVVHGFGGSGKTALAREAAAWLARTGMYAGALFVSFEHGGDAAVLLSALGSHLGVYDAGYDPGDPPGALARLRPALERRPTLLVADNVETLLPGGEAPLDAAARDRLWGVLLELAAQGAGVLLTGRDPDLAGPMAPGPRVAYLGLGGLHPDDAHALASRLLEGLGIDPARAPYPELRDLLADLDHHPLAIQLVLPALRDLPLCTLRADFAALLPGFADDRETGRNRSLLASLEYSLRRLSDRQRALLPRLALFEGGALESQVLAITQIPEAEWAALRGALERAALLSAERVHEQVGPPFLRFHPVLAPFLRGRPGVEDPALAERYARRYHGLAGYLYDEDTRNPHPARAVVRRELPNLRRALRLLLEMGEADAAVDMAECVARFLADFGLAREREELLSSVMRAGVPQGHAGESVLTRAEYLREINLGEDELARGEVAAAHARFAALLARIEALPEGAPRGPGSYEHCTTLHQLARCLRAAGQPAAAESRQREAQALADALAERQPGDADIVRQRGGLLTDLSDALREQGRYPEARKAYDERLEMARRQGDPRGQAVALGQLGTLALEQRDYQEARKRHREALAFFRDLGEPLSEALAWHQLGRVAGQQEQWAEAEACYREALARRERHGDANGAAQTCSQLAIVAGFAGRPAEAEGWSRRALAFPGLRAFLQAVVLNNLANLLLGEVRAGRAPGERLAEARSEAEAALAIKETLEASAQIWTTLGILAGIADLEGQPAAARDNRRREREAFAAFEGNRYHMDRGQGRLITAIAAAARGDPRARAAVEAALPRAEAAGWHVAEATRRLWAGERGWHALAEGLDAEEALLILRVLETLAGAGDEAGKGS